MAINPRKRQRQQERRAAKRQAKHQQLTKEKRTSPAERLAAAARCPILQCWATEDLWENGLGWVCLSRELPNGSVAYAVFLVDRYCLGVKNVKYGVASRFTYDHDIVRRMRSQFRPKELQPADVRKWVEAAVAYAASLGLHPHADYHKAKLIFGDIDASQATVETEFGKNGKPFFFAGPHDTPERCRRILKTLEDHCGPDGYHYVLPLMDPGKFLP